MPSIDMSGLLNLNMFLIGKFHKFWLKLNELKQRIKCPKSELGFIGG